MISSAFFPLLVWSIGLAIWLLQYVSGNLPTNVFFKVANAGLMGSVGLFVFLQVWAKAINVAGTFRATIDIAIALGLFLVAGCVLYLVFFGWLTLLSSEGIRFEYFFQLGIAMASLTALLHGYALTSDIDPRVERVSEANRENKKLIVVIHGVGGPATMNDVSEFLVNQGKHQSQLNETDIIRLDYFASPASWQFLRPNVLSNREPFDLVKELDTKLSEFTKLQDYEQITLVGHSAGATLCRKLYLYGLGVCSEGKLNRTKCGEGVEQSEWAPKVKRIVLLSGLNRGFAISGPPPQDVSKMKYAAVGVATYLGDLIGVGGFIRSFESGSPFIANLRQDWIGHFAKLARAETSKNHSGNQEGGASSTVLQAEPGFVVVQVRGDIDDIVSADDSHDLASIEYVANAEFISLTVAGAGHSDLIQLPEPTNKNNNVTTKSIAGGPAAAQIAQRDPNVETALDQGLTDYREARILDAFLARKDEKHLKQFHGDKDIDRVVVVLHGIRDFGRWAANFHSEFKNSPRTAVENPRYGYFGMGSFLLGAERKKFVKWFMDEITEISSKYPNATIDFVGHSNGTYLFAQALAEYESLKVRNVVFAGSVVETTYDWQSKKKKEQVVNVLNVTASGDWVVALFPRFFEFWGIRRPQKQVDFLAEGNSAGVDPECDSELVDAAGVGSAGFSGFDDEVAVDVRIAGDHSAFQKWIPQISAYLDTADAEGFRKAVVPPEGEPKAAFYLASPISSLIVFAVLALLIVWVGVTLIGPARQFTPYVALLYTVTVVWLLQRI